MEKRNEEGRKQWQKSALSVEDRRWWSFRRDKICSQNHRSSLRSSPTVIHIRWRRDIYISGYASIEISRYGVNHRRREGYSGGTLTKFQCYVEWHSVNPCIVSSSDCLHYTVTTWRMRNEQQSNDLTQWSKNDLVAFWVLSCQRLV